MKHPVQRPLSLAVLCLLAGAPVARAQTPSRGGAACVAPSEGGDRAVTSAYANAEGTSVTFCLVPSGDERSRHCYQVDLPSGRFTSVSRPHTPAAPAATFPTARVERGALSVCTSAAACTPVALPRRVRSVTVNAHNTRALAVSVEGPRLRAQWIVLPAGTPGASFVVRPQAASVSRVELLGDTALFYDCVDAGPGCTGSLLRDDGRRLSFVGGRTAGFNLYASRPILVGDDSFAVADSDGSQVALQDPRTGRVTANASVPSAGSPESGAVLVRVRDGFALVSGGQRPGHVTLLDPRTLATRGHWALPTCPAVP